MNLDLQTQNLPPAVPTGTRRTCVLAGNVAGGQRTNRLNVAEYRTTALERNAAYGPEGDGCLSEYSHCGCLVHPGMNASSCHAADCIIPRIQRFLADYDYGNPADQHP